MTVFGPGLVVMLADADAGSIITAAPKWCIVGLQVIVGTVYIDTYTFHCARTDGAFRDCHRKGARGVSSLDSCFPY